MTPLHCIALFCMVSYFILWYPIPLHGTACYCICVGFGARAVSRKTPIYFIFYYYFLSLPLCKLFLFFGPSANYKHHLHIAITFIIVIIVHPNSSANIVGKSDFVSGILILESSFPNFSEYFS